MSKKKSLNITAPIIIVIAMFLILGYIYCDINKIVIPFSGQAKAIELVKKTRFLDATYQEWVNMKAESHPNNRYKWYSTSTSETGIYKVSFACNNDQDSVFFECDIDNEIVKMIDTK